MTADFIGSLVGILGAAWIVAGLSLAATIRKIIVIARRAIAVVGSRHISEHRKEHAVPIYSIRLFRYSLLSGLQITLAVAAFAALFTAVHWLLGSPVTEALPRLLLWETQLIALATGILVGAVYWRATK